MGFLTPDTPEKVKFSYNVLNTILMGLTGALWQMTGVWLPFVFATVLYAFIANQMYLAPFLSAKDNVSEEDKDKIAYHAFITSNISRAEEKMEHMRDIMQRQSARIDQLEKELKK